MSSDLKKRTFYGALFVVVMVTALMFRMGAFCLMMVIMAGAAEEFLDLTLGKGNMPVQRFLAKLAGFLLMAVMFLYCIGDIGIHWAALALIPVLAIPLSCIFIGKIEQMDKLMPIYTALVYIVLPIALSPFILFIDGQYSCKLILSFFVLIWLSDTGAYCVGSLLGQKPGARKLAPGISPKKSWWGFWGSIAMGAITSVVLYFCSMLEFPLVHCVVLGVLVPAACVCGDLVESMWKRRYGVKDSGNLIPGHGGFLDRFDSSLTAIPLGVIYLLTFNLI